MSAPFVSADTPAPREWWHKWLLIAILLVAAAPRIWAACDDLGYFHDDEVYQSLEPAHKLVFGHGLEAWEFRDGARSWILPGIYAGLWKGASVLGVTSSLTLVTLAHLFAAALSILAIWASMRIAQVLAGLRAALVTGALAATLPLLLALAHRPTAEGAAAPFAALAVLFYYRGRFTAAGLAAGATFVFRIQNGLVGVFLVALLLGRREIRAASKVAGGAIIVVLASGLCDWLTWGSPFSSTITYLRFNLSPAAAATFGAQPITFFPETLLSTCGPAIFVVAAAFLGGLFTRARTVGALVLVYILVHSLVPHKEPRFLVGILPLACAVAGVGIDRGLARWRSRWAMGGVAVAVTALVIVQGLRAADMTYEDMRDPNGAGPIWHSRESMNRLLHIAGEQPDVCGVVIPGQVGVGSFTFLHRSVPLITLFRASEAGREVANYWILAFHEPDLPRSPPLPSLVAEDGDLGLYRRDGICVLPPMYREVLAGADAMGLHPLILIHRGDSSSGVSTP